jgi:hypothetical protein
VLAGYHLIHRGSPRSHTLIELQPLSAINYVLERHEHVAYRHLWSSTWHMPEAGRILPGALLIRLWIRRFRLALKVLLQGQNRYRIGTVKLIN